MTNLHPGGMTWLPQEDKAITSDPTIIEVATRVLQKEPLLYEAPDECPEIASAVLAAVTPLIRAAALEHAAKTLELVATIRVEQDIHFPPTAIAAAIRALKEQP